MGLIHAQGQLKNKTLRKNDKPSVSNSFFQKTALRGNYYFVKRYHDRLMNAMKFVLDINT